jgi:CheY-like chemotaxis protein
MPQLAVIYRFWSSTLKTTPMSRQQLCWNMRGFPLSTLRMPHEALHKLRCGGSRAVLADALMPGMHGLEFLDKALQAESRNLRDHGHRRSIRGLGHRSH